MPASTSQRRTKPKVRRNSDVIKKSFNYFRQGLFGLTVITFDELLHRLKQLYCFDEIDNSMAETTSTDFETGNPWQSW